MRVQDLARDLEQVNKFPMEQDQLNRLQRGLPDGRAMVKGNEDIFHSMFNAIPLSILVSATHSPHHLSPLTHT
jgi:hypothetical protein